MSVCWGQSELLLPWPACLTSLTRFKNPDPDFVGHRYNYFEFGQRYVGTLVDHAGSVLGHRERWDRIAAVLKEGHNVVGGGAAASRHAPRRGGHSTGPQAGRAHRHRGQGKLDGVL